MGGLLLEHFWWGSVFLINVPVMVAALVAGLVLLPESRGETSATIDWLSSALSVVAVVAVVLAIKHFISDGLDTVTVAALVVGLLSGWRFVRRQTRLETPLLDVSLFRLPAFSGALAANVLALFGFLGLLFFYSQYLQLVRGYGPLKAGLAEMPATLASIVVVALIGLLLARLGAGRAIGLGLAVAAVGLTMMSLTSGWDSYWGLGIGLAVIGLGVGVAMTLSVDAVVGAVPPERAGAASAVSETGYELGGALGIAVLGSINGILYRSALDLPAGTSDAERAHAEDSLAAAVHHASADVVAVAQGAFTDAMQATALLAAGILAVAAVVAWKVIPSPKVGPGAARVEH